MFGPPSTGHFSAAGDPAVGVALTAMYAPVWLLHLSLLLETKDRVEQALANLERPT